MRIDEAVKIINDMFLDKMNIFRKKNHDYANQEDVLKNFKQVAGTLQGLGVNIQPYEVCVFHIVHKLQRIINLTKQGFTPQNESLGDNVVDASVYMDILLLILKENEELNKIKG